jgi:hypothetical protein
MPSNDIYIFEDDPDRLDKMRELLADGATARTWMSASLIDGKVVTTFSW